MYVTRTCCLQSPNRGVGLLLRTTSFVHINLSSALLSAILDANRSFVALRDTQERVGVVVVW